MADILRACRGVPGFLDAAEITLLEASPALRDIQAAALGKHKVAWLDGLDALPKQPLFLIANEFFDALPIRQFLRDGDGWRERQIGLEKNALVFGLGPVQPQPMLDARLEITEQGDLIEVCAALAPIMDTVAHRISTFGGAALIIDYGGQELTGDTFQAVQDHQKVDPLEKPGMADLTAHVDFAALAQTAAACRSWPLLTQGTFLERLGITQRARTLAQTLRGDALENHITAHRRLTHPEEMGNLFKVLALTKQGSAPPPGFEP